MPIPTGLWAMMIVIAIGTVGAIVAARGRYTGMPPLRRSWHVVEDWICVFLVIGMLAASSLQVVARYLFSDEVTIPWTEELSRLLLVWSVLWGAIMVQREDDQIAMSAIFDALPPAIRFCLRMLSDVVTLVCLGLLFWYGCENTSNLAGIATTALGMSLAAFALVIPVMAALMIVFTLRTCVRRVQQRARTTGESEQ